MSKGRPQNLDLQEKTKTALMQAAAKLLSEKTLNAISIRELASVAGTQSAMISYYFGSKSGLIEALIKQTATERQKALAEISRQAMSTPDSAIEVLVHNVIDVVARDPWLFKLLQPEVVKGNEQLRELVVKEFSTIGPHAVKSLITQLQALGVVSKQANFQYFMASFMSLVIQPIANPFLLNVAVGFDAKTVGSEQWKHFVSQQLIYSLTIEV